MAKRTSGATIGEQLDAKAGKASPPTVAVAVKPLNFQVADFEIEGDAPYVQNKFSQKAKEKMKATQEAGSVSQSKRGRTPKDFEAEFKLATHRSKDGKCGIPAPAFRNAMISACRTVGFKMTHAKLGVFIVADFFDATDGTPLVLLKAEPKMNVSPVRNDNGSTDLRPRPMWAPGWSARLRVRFDADMLSLEDITNLVVRVGAQVGIGAGRPDSRESAGCGWGTFAVVGKTVKGKKAA